MNSAWRGRAERGSVGAIRLIVSLALHAGRRACRFLLVPICGYFFATAPQFRRSSREFLHRARGGTPTWGATFVHLYVFSTSLLDRVYLMHGRQRELSIDVTNEVALSNALASGRGCLLLGSHLGSFEMLGFVGSVEKGLKINMVMHVDDGAQMGNIIQEGRSPLPYRVIPLGRPGSMLQVGECLARGEIVGILADRVYGDEATRALPFLGAMARFSLGPTRLARVTGTPVVAVFGLFTGGRRYEIIFEPLAERVHDAPENLAAADARPLKASTISSVRCLTDYVARLEYHARRSPYNWFNFYDYWKA